VPIVVLVALAFGLLGLTDDVRSLTPTSRLAAQVGLGVISGLALLGSFDEMNLVWMFVVAVWLVGFVNAFNFMDGINGISSATTIIIGSSLAIASYRWNAGIELPALATVGAALGFAPFNLTNRVFLGDIGSYMLGAALSMLAVVGVTNGIPVIAAAAPFALYLADVAYTLTCRAARGERLMEAHRQHVYQRLANDNHWGHRKTTLVVSVVTFSLVALGHAGANTRLGQAALAASVSALMVALYLALPAIEQRRFRA
jgi:UDP-N-acetylmuramyl pentapeptide phosphotransferase/UDP-N-acetylglucosamine-1-phosphate transferase